MFDTTLLDNAPWDLLFSSKEAIGIGLLGVITFIVCMLLAREFVCWFLKIHTRIAGQRVAESLLDEQNELIAENNNLLKEILKTIQKNTENSTPEETQFSTSTNKTLKKNPLKNPTK